MADRVTKSVWFRIACFTLGLVFLYLSLHVFQTGDPVIREGDEPFVSGHTTFRLDRAIVAFPGDCTTAFWDTRAARNVTLNTKTVPQLRTDTLCFTPWMTPKTETLTVTYLNGTQQKLTITPEILSMEPKTWLFPILAVLTLLAALQPFRRLPARRRATRWGVVTLCVLLATVTVAIQISDKTFDKVMRDQSFSHYALLRGTARFNQWQYRVLSDYVAEGGIRAGERFGVSYPAVFTIMRLAQNLLLFLLAAYYFHVLGANTQVVLIGLMLTSWAVINSNYDLALVFDTYTDIIFYLLAAILIVRQKFIWIIPVTLLASLNRETSGLIPVLLLTSQVQLRPLKLDRRVILIGALSLAVWMAAQLAVRDIYGWRPGQGNYDHALGLDLIGFNLGREISWRELFSTLNLVPLLALFQLRRTLPILQRFFWTLVPIWVIIHFASGIVAESRLFLVPMIVVLVPIVLTGISQMGKPALAVDGVNRYAEFEQAGTLSRALPEHETGLSPGA